MRAKAKREATQGLKTGEIQLAVGTHALISDGVEFSSLALVITDEQHRFGVNQRTALAKKGNFPHTLVMSATPIPRTLALMIYGDLDVSVLNELPPGRQPSKRISSTHQSAAARSGTSKSTSTRDDRRTLSARLSKRAKATRQASRRMKRSCAITSVTCPSAFCTAK